MSVAKNTAYDYGSQVVGIVLVVAQSVILTRWLGKENYGTLIFVIQANVIASMLFNCSLQITNTYFAGKNRGRLGQLNTITVFCVLVITAIIWTGFHWVGPYVIGKLQSADAKQVPPHYVLISFALVPISIYYAGWIGLMVGLGAIRKLAYYNIAYSWIQTAVFLLVLVNYDLGLPGFLVAWAVLNLCHLAAMLIVLRTEGPIWHSFRLRDLGEFLSFSFRSHVGNFAGSLISKLDWLYASKAGGSEGMGIYSRAGSVYTYTLTAVDALERAGYRTVTEADRRESARIVQRMIRNCVILSFVGILLLIPMAKYVILIMAGHEFLEAVAPLRVLLVGLPFAAANRMLAMYVTGQLGKPHISSTVTWMALPVAFVLLHFLTPLYGYSGAAAAMVGTQIFLFMLFLGVFVRNTGLTRPADYLIPKPEDFRSFVRYFQQFFGKKV